MSAEPVCAVIVLYFDSQGYILHAKGHKNAQWLFS